ncbi:MAG: hypothetical protein NDI82_08225 [Anaeromyxobacteraceae bacterium]|nr:hypothetical protein [Anaeromyxobacteraceae bacterium]
MPLASALLLNLALAAGPERVLLCRPVVLGDPALARPEAVAAAVRPLHGLFLDYGVACESLGEAARAAGRAGLGHAALTSAEGRPGGAHYELVLTTAGAEEVTRRAVTVAAGEEPAAPLRRALRELESSVPRPPPRWPTVAGWGLRAAGAAALAAGAVYAIQARQDARRAAAATSPEAWQAARDDWRRDRDRSAVALAAGGGAAALGLTLRLAF